MTFRDKQDRHYAFWKYFAWITIAEFFSPIAVARKLAVILHRMWRDGTDFIWSSKEVAA